MHDLDKLLHPPSNKGGEYDQADWTIRNKEFSEGYICVETKDGISESMQDEMEYKDKYYNSLLHE